MSWTVRRRHVTKFRSESAPLDSYRFPDTSPKPLTCRVCEQRAHACTREMDKYSYIYVRVSSRRAIAYGRGRAGYLAGTTLDDERPSSKGQRRNKAITVRPAKENANDYDATFMSSNVYRIISLRRTKQILLSTSGSRTRFSCEDEFKGF